MNSLSESIIEVEDFTVDYLDKKKWINVVNKLSFKIERGEIFGLAGESGCGKSTTGLGLFGYTKPGSYIREGTVIFMGKDLIKMKNSKLRSIRGSKIFLIPQNPSSSLTPSMRVGQQVVETLESHKIEEEDRKTLRSNGFSDSDIWDISSVVGFFSMSNRIASATKMVPNSEYHSKGR